MIGNPIVDGCQTAKPAQSILLKIENKIAAIKDG
jgi:hypothetical protein